MKKMITRSLVALFMAAGLSTSANAQSVVTLSTISKMDFSKVTEKTLTVRTSRQFFAGYNTICLPFSLTAEQLTSIVGDGVQLEMLVQAEEGVLTFLDVTNEGIKAGMPYLIYSPKAQQVTFSTHDTNLATDPMTINVGLAQMCGRFEPSKEWNLFGIPAQQDKDILDAVLVRTEGDKVFYPTRCGFNYNGNGIPVIKHVKSFDETTAIRSLEASNRKVDIYNSNGILVQKNTSLRDAKKNLKTGVYIVNGMKLIVK